MSASFVDPVVVADRLVTLRQRNYFRDSSFSAEPPVHLLSLSRKHTSIKTIVLLFHMLMPSLNSHDALPVKQHCSPKNESVSVRTLLTSQLTKTKWTAMQQHPQHRGGVISVTHSTVFKKLQVFSCKKKQKKHMTRHSQQLILLSSCCQESWPFKVALFFLAWRCFCKVCQSLRRQRLLHSRSSVQLLSWLHVRGWKWTGLSTLTMSKPWQQLQAAPQ